MRALIKDKALISSPYANERPRKNYLEENRGKWVEIDTNYLFENQYNTVDGFRIYDDHIERIEDDVRFGYPDFKDAFFVKHPNGCDEFKNVDFYLSHNGKNIPVYSVESGKYYRISRRTNIEFIIVDGKPYLRTGIGYNNRLLDLSNNERTILRKAIEKIKNS